MKGDKPCAKMRVDGTYVERGRVDGGGKGTYPASLSTFRVGITNLLDPIHRDIFDATFE